MNVDYYSRLINESDYWDLRVLNLNCNYFADEVDIIIEFDEKYNITYQFKGCYKTIFDHEIGFEKFKPSKDLTFAQIPYFMQNITVKPSSYDDIIIFKILMPPLEAEIWCKDFEIVKKKKKFKFNTIKFK